MYFTSTAKYPVSNRPEPPAFLGLRSHTRTILITVAWAIFVDIFAYSVIVPVLPFTLESRIGIASNQVQTWMSIALAIFAASILVGSPLFGYLADRLQNRRLPMLFGWALLLAATLLLCFSNSIPLLVIGRLLQGLACAMTWTVGLAFLVDSVDPKKVGAALGWTSIAQSCGIFTGPILGGVVYHGGGYYPVFGMCFAILGIDIFLRFFAMEKKTAAKWEERVQAAHVTLSQSVSFGQASTHVAEEFESRRSSESPIEKEKNKQSQGMLSLLQKSRLWAALLGTAVEAMIQTGFESTLPLFVNETFHWNSVGAGLVFLPIVIPTFLAPIVGTLGDRYGPKWLCTGGFLFTTPFLVCLRFVTENTLEQKVMLFAFLACIGFGLTFVFSPLMAEISWAVEDGVDENDTSAKPYAQAYGLYNVAFSGGAVVGPLLGGMLRQHFSFGTMGWAFGAITFITAVVQCLWIGGSPFQKRTPHSVEKASAATSV